MWSDIVLIAVLIICVGTDLHRRKIYNAVTFPALALALTLHFWFGGWSGLGASLAGFAAGIGLLLIPYFMGGMGAGDVKLLSVIGALKGSWFVVTAAVYMGLIGAAMAVVTLLLRKDSRAFFKQVVYFLYAFRCGTRMSFPKNTGALTAVMPYGVAIGGGALTAILTRGDIPI
ncbi:A24 family peptidase [Paenibacillus thermotolerans]|uniref:A24 family peptidase n=1 Tax=Paenibacillus thermotolerans TaxID=3027807 RepID=UPI002367ED0B|nr:MULTISPECIES: A24 family peptidase [unclassified Paenibacillus]